MDGLASRRLAATFDLVAQRFRAVETAHTPTKYYDDSRHAGSNGPRGEEGPTRSLGKSSKKTRRRGRRTRVPRSRKQRQRSPAQRNREYRREGQKQRKRAGRERENREVKSQRIRGGENHRFRGNGKLRSEVTWTSNCRDQRFRHTVQ